ncbi:Uu.00g110540.m01.CDS01 [Anthostomella pinea]|uniref:Uu.00g110540.m01.CDS01 n=1 Tax=Anthostomella pinea TaxID=933095 RepID=A0AAI8YGA4_9PEZI|nr:Uu.00g110540.m01.CDS01 [Anthostomella pinea]
MAQWLSPFERSSPPVSGPEGQRSFVNPQHKGSRAGRRGKTIVPNNVEKLCTKFDIATPIDIARAEAEYSEPQVLGVRDMDTRAEAPKLSDLNLHWGGGNSRVGIAVATVITVLVIAAIVAGLAAWACRRDTRRKSVHVEHVHDL